MNSGAIPESGGAAYRKRSTHATCPRGIPQCTSMPAANHIQHLLYVATCSAFVCLGVSVAFLGPSLPALHELVSERGGVTKDGWLFSLGGIAYFIGAGLNGTLDRSFEAMLLESLLLTVSLVVSGVSQAMLPFCRKRWQLGGLLFITRLGAGSLDVSGNSIIAASGSVATSWMQCLHACFSVGAYLAPLILAFWLRTSAYGLYLGFATYAVFVVFSLVLLFMYTAMLRRYAERNIPSCPTGNRAVDDKTQLGPVVASEAKAVISTTRQRLVRMARITLVVVVFASYAGYEVSLGAWLAVYAHEADGASKELAQADMVSALFWAAIMCSRLLAIVVSVWFSATTILTCCVIESLIAWLCTLWRLRSLRVLAACLGLAMGPAYAAQMSIAVEIFGDRERCASEVATWGTIGSTLGEALLPWIVGIFMSRFGLVWFHRTIMSYAFLWSAFAVALIWRRQRPQTMDPKSGASG